MIRVLPRQLQRRPWLRCISEAKCRAILGVRSDASQQDIKTAFLRAAMRTHPDRREGGDSASFLEATEAYEMLASKSAGDGRQPHTTTGVRDCPSCARIRAALRAGDAVAALRVWDEVVDRREPAVTVELVPLLFKVLGQNGAEGLAGATVLLSRGAEAGVFLDAEAHRAAYNDLLWALSGMDDSIGLSLEVISEMEGLGFQPDFQACHATFRYFGGVGA